MESTLPLNKLKASVVIRCKNEGDRLRELLDSLFEQTEMGFELIIVDNNSADKTSDILKDFPVATYINIPDDEFNHALSCNLGIYAARTNYVILTNGHCLPISTTWLADGLSAFTDEKIAAVDGNYRSRRDGSKQEKLSDILQADTLNIRRENQPITTTNAIIRKNLWQEYQFDEKLTDCEDYDWSKEMISRGYKTVKDPRFNVYHSHGLTKEAQESRYQHWQIINAEIDARKRPGSSQSAVFDDNFWKQTKIKIQKYL